jgi:hypothetical protein
MLVMDKQYIKTFLKAATEKNTISTSTNVALFAGSILALVNYGDHIFFHLYIPQTGLK